MPTCQISINFTTSLLPFFHRSCHTDMPHNQSSAQRLSKKLGLLQLSSSLKQSNPFNLMQADEKTLIEFKLTLQCTGELTSLLNNALSLPINYTAVKLFPQWSRHRSHHIQIISPNEVARHHVRDKSPGNGVFPIAKICPGFYESLHFFSALTSDHSDLLVRFPNPLAPGIQIHVS